MNDEISSLRADVDELKEEVALLKGVTPPKMSKQINELSSEVKTLQEEVKSLKDTLNNQNSTILRLLKDQKQLIANLTDAAEKLPLFPKGTSVFPVESIEQLEELEASINDDNLGEHVQTMRLMISGDGLSKNLRTILSEACIMEVNVRGLASKKSLLDYKKFMNALYQASYTGEDWTHTVFLNELSEALKRTKNRVYKYRNESRVKSTKIIEESKGQGQFEEIFFSEDEDV